MPAQGRLQTLLQHDNNLIGTEWDDQRSMLIPSRLLHSRVSLLTVTDVLILGHAHVLSP